MGAPLGRIVLTLVFWTHSLQAQQSYCGVVQDAQHQMPVPYATVGLIRESIGVTADTTGQFELTSTHSQPGDMLLFQALGYQSLKRAVSAFTGIHVLLIPSVRELEEV
jgi:hypothetical protein